MSGQVQQTVARPYLEADLIWSEGGRVNRGTSDKNPTTKHGGILVYEVSSKPIIYWLLEWNYKFVIYNNSSAPALNLAMKSIGKKHFDELPTLPKINNLPAWQNLDKRARLISRLEGDYTQADAILLDRIPAFADEITLEISYQNEQRQTFKTIVTLSNGEIHNTFI